MKRAFEKIMAGLDEAIAYAKGDESRGRAHGPAKVKVRQAGKTTRPDSFLLRGSA